MNTLTESRSREEVIKNELLTKHQIEYSLQTVYFKERWDSLIQTTGSKRDEDIVDELKRYHDSVSLLKKELPDVNSEIIDKVCHYLLVVKQSFYWEKQSASFKSYLKSLLQDTKNTRDSIVEKVNLYLEKENQQNRSAHARAGWFGPQTLNSSIGVDQLQDETISRLTGLINPLPVGVKISCCVNKNHLNDNSAYAVIADAKEFFRDPINKHVMFAVGNGHWYWVTISKTENQHIPYSVEVFDPYCRETSSIYRMLRNYLPQFEEKPFQNKPRLIQPQQDYYSCGYYVASYAHLKIKQIDDSANCNQDMINALKTNNPGGDILKNACIRALNPEQAIQLPEPVLKMSRQRVFNRRGVQYAFLITLSAEALTLGVFLAMDAAIPLSIKFSIMFLVAVLSVIFSDIHIESITYSPLANKK